MSAPAFTPGPWREGIDGNNRVYGPNCAGEHTGLIAVVYKGRANIRLIAAAPKLYSDLERAVAFLRAAPLESGVCCCGGPIEGHGYDDGHSPVDELQYHAGGLADQFAATLALASAGEAGTATTTEIGVVHEHAAPSGETPHD